jgi:hypothetical protein
MEQINRQFYILSVSVNFVIVINLYMWSKHTSIKNIIISKILSKQNVTLKSPLSYSKGFHFFCSFTVLGSR